MIVLNFGSHICIQAARIRVKFFLLCEGGSSSGGGGGSHSNAGPGEGKDVVELTEANFRKKVINSEKVSLSQLYARASVLQIRYLCLSRISGPVFLLLSRIQQQQKEEKIK